MIYKTCGQCKEDKPVSEFYDHPANKDGLQSMCKICHKINSAEWKKNNKKRNDDKSHFYKNSERGFIKNTIATVFKNKRGKIVKITKPEIYEELLLHVERKKLEFPETDGRLCDYCDKPWTYIRRHANVDKKEYVKNPYNFSIDRLDNDVTYQKGNIIFCHSRCNDIKHSVTIEMCERILKLYKMKKENYEME
tara:strand:+ start:40 stop:618 length:579 start_codon:yes stop_codon:yes gene_type:complete